MRVRLTTFKATADADTALLRGHADLAQTDLVRVAFYRKNKLPIKAYLATDGLMALIVYSKLRINDIKTLRRRLVGIARHSASDYWSAEALKKADMDYNAIFRPQINDLALRASMLNEGQIEAAFLPEPYVTSARIAGHTVLFTSPENHAMGCWAIMEGKAKEQSRSTALEAVIRGYNMAVDSINIQGKAACRPLLTDIYGLKPEVIDSLHLPHYNHAKEPVQENLDAAKSFISSHK